MLPETDDQFASVSNLRLRLCIALAATSIVGMVLLTAILYGYFRQGLRQDIREHLRDVVSLAALRVDVAAHDSLRSPADEGTATYLRLRADLQGIRDAATDIRFVYTMRRGPRNEIVFVADAETNPDAIAHLGEIYATPGPALSREFATLAVPLVEDGFYSDKWGTWLSGYAPFYSAAGERGGVIGMDIAAGNVVARERHFLWAASGLCAATVPFLFLAAWMLSGRLSTKVKDAQRALGRRAALNRLISDVSSALVQLDLDGLDRGIESALARIGAFAQADRAYVFLFREDGAHMDNTHEWCSDGIEPQVGRLQNISVDKELPWFAERIRNGDVCHVPDVSALPQEATLEREHFEVQGIKSLIVLPVAAGERLLGFLGFDAVRRCCSWPDDEQVLLRLVGENFAHLLERKRAEEEKTRLEEQLAESRRLEAIGQLAGGVAHDFNNQLAGIINCAELLLRKPQDVEARCYAEMILQTAQRSADLTRQLLAFSRKAELRVTRVDVHALVTEVVSLLSHTIDKRVTITQRLKAEPSTTMGDASQLQSALLNLAINASDAMPEGGELGLATDVVDIDETFCGAHPYRVAPGTFLLIQISDTGAGMDEETLTHIFEPFFTTKGLGNGTGLGLAAVYGTVRSHDGIIAVDSQPGRGSVFKVYLPLASGTDADATPAEQPAPVATEATGRILFVDDEESVRKSSCEALRRLGYDVVAREHGASGVEYYREFWRDVDVVILDMMMPKMNGRDAFRIMRQVNPKVKVLLLSGFSLDNRIQEVLDEGALDYLQKPFLLAELYAKTAQLLA